MSDGEELLGKANALLSRYKTGSSQQDVGLSDFPVLTEIVEEVTAVAQPLSDASHLLSSTADTSSPILGLTLEQELQQLEKKLRQGVLNAIEPHLASFLGEPFEMRIREHLDPAISRLAAEIISAVRMETAEMVHKAVSVAVEREIAELQARLRSDFQSG